VTQAGFELTEALAQARRELPPGPVVEQLRNYCGRVWDVLRTPAFAEACRQSLVRRAGKGAAHGAIEACLADVHRLLVAGVRAGELRPVSCGPLARLLVSSLLARACWCAYPDRIGARIAGTCTRVVAETLDVLLPAITVTPPGAPIAVHEGGPA
jgi:hypothetical protein